MQSEQSNEIKDQQHLLYSKKVILKENIPIKLLHQFQKIYQTCKNKNINLFINYLLYAYPKHEYTNLRYIQQLPNVYFIIQKDKNSSNIHEPLRNLQGTNWPNLKYLVLSHCQIQNIQSFCFANMPVLEVISLRYNKITNIKPLEKTNFSQLINFQLINKPYDFKNPQISRMKGRKIKNFELSNSFNRLSMIHYQCVKIQSVYGIKKLKNKYKKSEFTEFQLITQKIQE